MSIDQQILQLVTNAGDLTCDDVRAQLPDVGTNIVQMRIGALVSAGKLARDGNTLTLGDGKPRPGKYAKPRKAKEPTPPPEPQPFEVAVFMDGTVELINATITDNGSVCLPAADARRMAEHILALLPTAAVTVTE